jgi:formylglycine-generating enzyme required for sulfatase activity
MGKYEVTQAQWERVMGSNPSRFTSAGASAPVEQVSWDDCQEFVRKVNTLVPGGAFRLPTEAEWEYACRAGTTGPYAGNLDDLGWYGGNSENTTHAVGRKKANAWNLYDMHGNVWEWCSDWFGEQYPSWGVTDPAGPGSGSGRVCRGGGWINDARFCRSAGRSRNVPGIRYYYLGLRLARSPP